MWIKLLLQIKANGRNLVWLDKLVNDIASFIAA